MFEPFERLQARTTGTGVGLGLAVVKGFLDTMGGTVAAADTPGGGLTIRVTLPTAARARPVGPAARQRDRRAVTRVLVIDDEAPILRALRINLTARKYEVSTAADGTSGLAAMARDRPDVLILDLGLPDMDGTEVIKGVRGWTSTPDHRAVRLGPGEPEGGRAGRGRGRLRDQAVRHGRAAGPAARRGPPGVARPRTSRWWSPSDFTVDLAAKRVTRDGADVRLTPTEWQLLEVLVRTADRLVTQRQLLQEVWGPEYQTEGNYLRVYVANLRRKLEPDPSRPRYLLTEPGMGYRFRP